MPTDISQGCGDEIDKLARYIRRQILFGENPAETFQIDDSYQIGPVVVQVASAFNKTARKGRRHRSVGGMLVPQEDTHVVERRSRTGAFPIEDGGDAPPIADLVNEHVLLSKVPVHESPFASREISAEGTAPPVII